MHMWMTRFSHGYLETLFAHVSNDEFRNIGFDGMAIDRNQEAMIRQKMTHPPQCNTHSAATQTKNRNLCWVDDDSINNFTTNRAECADTITTRSLNAAASTVSSSSIRCGGFDQSSDQINCHDDVVRSAAAAVSDDKHYSSKSWSAATLSTAAPAEATPNPSRQRLFTTKLSNSKYMFRRFRTLLSICLLLSYCYSSNIKTAPSTSTFVSALELNVISDEGEMAANSTTITTRQQKLQNRLKIRFMDIFRLRKKNLSNKQQQRRPILDILMFRQRTAEQDTIEDSLYDPMQGDCNTDTSNDDSTTTCEYEPPASTIETEMVRIDTTHVQGLIDASSSYGGQDPDACSSSDDSTKTCKSASTKEIPLSNVDKHWGADATILAMRDHLRHTGSGCSTPPPMHSNETTTAYAPPDGRASNSKARGRAENRRPPIFLMPGLASTRLVAWKYKVRCCCWRLVSFYIDSVHAFFHAISFRIHSFLSYNFRLLPSYLLRHASIIHCYQISRYKITYG